MIPDTGGDGGWAFLSSVGVVCKRHFGYKHSCKNSKDTESESEMHEMMENEMPKLYCGKG